MDRGIKLLKVHNPFDKTQRSEEIVPYKGETLLEICKKNFPSDIEVIISVNGRIVPKEKLSTTIVKVQDEVVFIPKVDAPVAGLIVMMAANLAATKLSTVLALGKIGTALVTGGFMALGGMVLNTLFPPPSLDMGAGAWSDSNLYSWNPTTTQQQGTPIPRIYGENKIKGNIISAFTDIDYSDRNDNFQYMHLLICLGYGPINSISDMKVNDKDIDWYDEMTYETTVGESTQDVLTNFDNIVKEIAYDDEITSGSEWTTYETQVGDVFDTVEIHLTYPKGVWVMSETSGGLNDIDLTVESEYKRDIDGSWTTGPSVTLGDGGDADFYAKRQFRKLTFGSLAGGKYYFRVKRDRDKYTRPNGTSVVENKQNLWAHEVRVTSVILKEAEELTYPLHALVGMKVKATDQLYGSINFECVIEGRPVRVYDGASWSIEYSTNPAWICYDILTQPVLEGVDASYSVDRYEGMDPSRLDTDAFKDWADWCDQLVSGDYKRCTFNGGFDKEMNMWDAALQVCRVGRAVLVWNGVIVSVVYDAPADSVQLFTVGNIGETSFSEKWMSLDERANTVEIEFVNSEEEYRRDVLTIVNSNVNSTGQKVRLPLFGITNENEAIRSAKFHLLINEHLKRIVEWRADVDALACSIGDRVTLQHDAPKWGLGGRVISSSSTTVTVDQMLEAVGDLGSELITNGDMELDANWADVGTPDVNERSTEQVYAGTYSRKFTASGPQEGIQSDTFSVTAGTLYQYIVHVFPEDTTNVRIVLADGDGTSLDSSDYTGLKQGVWNKLVILMKPTVTGASARVQIRSVDSTGTWFVDDVSVKSAEEQEIIVRIAGDDTLETKGVTKVVPANAHNSIVTVDTSWTTNPSQYDPYGFGEENVSLKDFKIIDIEREQNQRVKLSGIQYDPSIYEADGLYADFSATPLSGNATLTVQFTDESIGENITAWSWNFGDGGSSSSQNPSHDYSSPGTYTVTLTVTEGALTSYRTKYNLIVVYGAAVSPTDIDDCKLWLDAKDSSFTLDGANVDQWNDLSGNGNHATGSGASRPTKTTYGGDASVFFDQSGGTKQFLTLDQDDGSNYWDSSYGMTVMIVYKNDETDDDHIGGLFCAGQTGSPYKRRWRVSTDECLISGGSGDTLQTGELCKYPVSKEHSILTMKWDPNVGIFVYRNGTLISVNKKLTTMRTDINGFVRLAYSWYNATNFYYYGHIQSVAVWSRSITESERLQVEGYFAAAGKYDVGEYNTWSPEEIENIRIWINAYASEKDWEGTGSNYDITRIKSIPTNRHMYTLNAANRPDVHPAPSLKLRQAGYLRFNASGENIECTSWAPNYRSFPITVAAIINWDTAATFELLWMDSSTKILEARQSDKKIVSGSLVNTKVLSAAFFYLIFAVLNGASSSIDVNGTIVSGDNEISGDIDQFIIKYDGNLVDMMIIEGDASSEKTNIFDYYNNKLVGGYDFTS